MYLPYQYYRNSEKYADPTAGEAMFRVMQEEKQEKRARQQRRNDENAHVTKETDMQRVFPDLTAPSQITAS